MPLQVQWNGLSTAKRCVIAFTTILAAYRNQGKDIAFIRNESHTFQMFRRQIIEESYTGESRSSLFIASVLLCILGGILEPIIKYHAQNHLTRGRIILRELTDIDWAFRSHEKLLVPMLSIFATIDLTHAILNGDSPCLKDESRELFQNFQTWWGYVLPEDKTLNTMKKISYLAVLGHEAWNISDSEEQKVLGRSVPRLEENAVSLSPVGVICACYQSTASIYAGRVLLNISVNNLLVQEWVSRCIEVLRTKLDESIGHHILFPLLIMDLVDRHGVQDRNLDILPTRCLKTLEPQQVEGPGEAGVQRETPRPLETEIAAPGQSISASAWMNMTFGEMGEWVMSMEEAFSADSWN